MASAGIEPEVGKRYRYSYIGGRVYDPDRMEEEGIFVKKITSPPNGRGETTDYYIMARRFPGYQVPGRHTVPETYHLNYITKNGILQDNGGMAGVPGYADFRLDDLLTVMNSSEFVHPRLDGFMTPFKQVYGDQIAEILRKERARGNIGSFMTHVIYHPPIKRTNASGAETTVFTGGPMYKRGLASFGMGAANDSRVAASAAASNAPRAAGASGNKRKSRKQRGGLGQPLSYTDPTHQEPSANAGFNRQGIEPPYLIRPALNAIPMSGGNPQNIAAWHEKAKEIAKAVKESLSKSGEKAPIRALHLRVAANLKQQGKLNSYTEDDISEAIQRAKLLQMGGAEQILSPMSFRDAYHSDPMAPTGQPLTDLKLPATLRQGLNLGPLSGGRRRNTRRNTRRGGFYPSIMGGVVANAPLLAPLAARQGIHLLEEYRRTTRKRRSTRKSNRRRNSGRRA